MISIKSQREIDCMRRAGEITGLALAAGGRAVEPGVTTAQIDRIVRESIVSRGATPSFLGYRGYPASCCISINSEVIHGIPGSRKLRPGDIVSIDVGAFYDGFHGDTAATFPVGDISPEAARLIEVTRKCFFDGVKKAMAGARIGDISRAVEKTARGAGYGVVRDYTGHGVGRQLHEDPSVPNYSDGSHGPRLLPGMTFAIEPMINAGGDGIIVLKDGWTVKTADGSLSAHYEHTVCVTDDSPILLTQVTAP